MANQSQALSVFNFKSNAIRVVADDKGEPWFLANDVCNVLGYKNTSKSIADHCRVGGITKRYTPTESGNQEMTYINEGNLYRLIIKSRKPEAEPFESWVCDEVLPSIRKTGSYTAPRAIITPEQKAALFAIVAKRAGDNGKIRAQLWARHNKHFRIAKYEELLAIHFDAAVHYLETLELAMPKNHILGVTMQEEQNNLAMLSHDTTNKVMDYIGELHHEIQRLGGKLPTSPQFDKETIVKAVVTSMVNSSRMLLSFSASTGQPCINFVPQDCWVVTSDNIANIVGSSDGVPKRLLPDIAKAAVNRLSGN